MRAVTELWRQDQQTSRHRRGRTKAQRLAHCDLLREEGELMGHEVAGLHPLEFQTYLRAVEELTVRREAGQLAKPDRGIMRWRSWGMRRIMKWRRVEAEQRLGKCKRKLLGGRSDAGIKRQRRLMEMGVERARRCGELERPTGWTLCGSPRGG